jgi:hypothetical protein
LMYLRGALQAMVGLFALAAANNVCPFPFWTYEEFIGAKKHLVLGVLSHTAPRR